MQSVLRSITADGYLSGIKAAGDSHPDIGIQQIGPTSTLSSGIDWDTWKPGDTEAALKTADGGLKDLLDQVNLTIRGIDDTTMNRLGNILSDGLAAGNGPDDIARDMRDYVGDPARAEMIATTEANRAQTDATSDQLQEMGFNQFDWLAYDGACEECLDLEDNNPWDMDSDQPPDHPNCRCSIVGSVEATPSEDSGDGTTSIESTDQTTEPASDSPSFNDATSAMDWVSNIQDMVSKLGEMPEYVQDLTADVRTPTEEMRAWVDGAKDIGSKISQQIEDKVAKTTGQSPSDARVMANKTNDHYVSTLKEAKEAWRPNLLSDYSARIDPEFPSTLTKIIERLNIDLKSSGNFEKKIIETLYDRIPNGVDDELKAEYKTYLDLQQRIEEAKNADNIAREALKEANKAFTDAVFEVLGQVREFGGVDINFADSLRSSVVRKTVDNNSEMAKILNNMAQKVFPKDWLEESNKAGETVVDKVQARGWNETLGIRGKSEITSVINADTSEGLLSHEFMHRMEYVMDGISRAEWTFLHSRLDNVKGRLAQSMNSLTTGGYRKTEVAIKDNFTEAYSGKFYDRLGQNAVNGWKYLYPDERTGFEVMTTGIEDLVSGGSRIDYGLTSAKDLDFRSFVLGVLVSI